MARLAERLGPDGTLPELPGATLMGLPCVGTLHPEMLVKSLEAGARGVFVAGCVPEDCPFREGSLWLAQRLRGERLPALKRAPEGRLRVRWYLPVETARFVRDVRAFQEDLLRGDVRAVRRVGDRPPEPPRTRCPGPRGDPARLHLAHAR
jgi:coenzyme F420-reducing hydrogenase delta subunit